MHSCPRASDLHRGSSTDLSAGETYHYCGLVHDARLQCLPMHMGCILLVVAAIHLLSKHMLRITCLHRAAGQATMQAPC